MAIADLFKGIFASGSAPQVGDYFGDLEAPEISDMELHLEQLVQQGVISPEEAQTIKLEKSGFNGISLDPNLKKAQMEALSSLQEIGDGGGMTAMDRANIARIQNEENSAARGQREAILQNAQARGMGGSGLELMSQMQNQQDSATRASQRDLDVAGMAQQRALDAIMQQGQMAGQIQNQDFNQQAQVAQANDAISKFNAQNQQGQINRNVDARNNAQQTNLNAKQNIHNQNVGTRNQQQQYNKELQQRNFENELNKRRSQAGLATSNAQIQGQNSQNQANASNMGLSSAVGIAKAAAGGMNSGGIIEGDSENIDSVLTPTTGGEFVVQREDVPEFLKKAHTDDDGEFDAAAFLDSITGHKYGYSKKKGA